MTLTKKRQCRRGCRCPLCLQRAKHVALQPIILQQLSAPLTLGPLLRKVEEDYGTVCRRTFERHLLTLVNKGKVTRTGNRTHYVYQRS